MLLLENVTKLCFEAVTGNSELGRVAVRNVGKRYFDGDILDNTAGAESLDELASTAKPARIREKRDRANGI